MKTKTSFVIGFLILFFIYHFPEFFSEFWISAVCKILFLVAAYLVAKMQGFKGLQSWGLLLHKGWWKNLLLGFLFGVVTYLASTIIAVQLKIATIDAVPSFTKTIQQLPYILLITSIPSIAEDILTRGYLYKHFHKSLKMLSWIFVSATVFYLNHIWRYNDGAAVFAYLFMMGILLAYAVQRTNSLWLAFGLHWGFNCWYQSTVSIITVNDNSQHKESTWIFAGCILILFMIFVLTKTTRLFSYNTTPLQ